MEILTVLDELYHVNPEDVNRVWSQLYNGSDRLKFRDGRKHVQLFVRNIVSIEYFEELE